MAVDVSRIPNNNKFDPVREAILQLQTEIEDTGNTIGNGTLTIGTSGSLSGSGTFTANQSSNSTITIGIDDSDYLSLSDTGEQTIAGDIVISGDLTVSGTTTYINTTNLNIGDNIITLNADLPSGTAPTENAGIEINRGSSTDVSFVWNETSDKWTLGSETLVAGTFEGLVIGNVTGDLTGNASTATALETARNIAVDGAVTGNADFDGSGDITITTSVNHNHDDRYYTETESDNRFVNVDGDTMTDDLNFDSGSKVRLHSGSFADANDRYEIFATGEVMFLQYWDNDQGDGSSLQKPILGLKYTGGAEEATLFGDLRLKSGNVASPTYDAVVLDLDKVNGHVDITNVRNGTFSGDLTATTNLIVGTTNVYDALPTGLFWDDTDDKFKIGVTANGGNVSGGSLIQPLLLANILNEGYIPYVATGGGGSSIVNSRVSDSWLKLTSNTLELGASDPVSHEIRYARFLWQAGSNDKISTVYGAKDITASIQYLGGSTTAKIEFTGGSGGGRIQFNDEYTFPVTDGTSGQVLSTNGSGDLSWVAAGGPTTSDLQDVTDNGATTTNSITVNGLTSNDDITTTGNLFIGTVGQQNWIAFSGTTGDGGSAATYTTTYIGERIYGGTEQSELIIYKGNDGHASTASPDRIRMIGANLCFDTYNIAQGYPTDLDGVAALTTTRAMTIDTNQHVSITNGNLAVETGVIKIGTNTVIDASRVGYFTRINADSGTSGGLVVHNGGITASNNYMNFFTAQTSGWSFNANGTGADTDSVLRISADGSIDSDGGLVIDGTATFNSVAVFKGQVSNYDGSTGRTSYWNYDDKVAAVFEPAADDGAVAILFPSIGNTPSDFGYIAFDEDYGEAGVAAGENSALIIGCENDGGGSSDHVRVKGRLVVEADMSSSDPTNAFQVKSGNVTGDLFRVARSGAAVFSSTLNVADQLSVDDAIRLTSNPSITGDTSGVYFWNQAGVGATIASNAFEVRTNGNTTAFSIDNSQIATIHNELRTNGNILVGGNSSLRHPALDRFVNVQSTTNGAIVGYNLAVIDGANNRRGSFFMDDSAGLWGLDHTYSSGSMDFVIRVAGGELMRVRSDGNVGIGISTPFTKTHIYDTFDPDDNYGYLLVENGNTTSGSPATNAAVNVKNYHGTSQFMQWEENGLRFGSRRVVNGGSGNVYITSGSDSVAMTILSGGNVGIGTTSPSYKLEVAGQAHIQGILSVSTGQQIRIGGASDPNHFLRKIATGYSGVTIDGPQLQGHQGGELTTNYTGDNWALRWAIGGKVYVNSTLDIGGGEAIHFTNTGTGTYNKTVIYQDSGNGFYVDAARATDSGSAARLPMTFTWRGGYTNNGGLILNGTTKLYTTDTGLGIGTTTPSARLDIDGQIQIGGSMATPNFGYGMFAYSGVGLGLYSAASGSTQGIGFWLNNGSAYEAGRWLSNGYLGVGETNPQQRLHINGVMRWGSSSYYAYSGVDGGGLYIEQVDNNTGRDRIRLQTRTNNSGTYTSFLIDAGDDRFEFANGDISLGREYGVTQLNNNKDWANMTSGIVWREYNHALSTHPTTSDAMTEMIKGGTFTEQGVVSNVDSFTRSDETYAVEFLGYYYATSNDIYSFSISSDDAGDIFIDGTRVADWYNGHGDSNLPTGGTGQNAGSIYLVKGFHKIYARYEEIGGGDSASLWHKIGSGSWEKIPADRLYHKAEDLFRATGSGNATLYGTFTATADIVAYSDERIKENVETIDNALDKVQQLRGVSFNRIKDGSKSIGVIAQEIEKVLPEVVTEDDKGIKGVAYGNVVGVLIEAIKEQQKQIDELKARLDGSTD